jgi:hypothetical protein
LAESFKGEIIERTWGIFAASGTLHQPPRRCQWQIFTLSLILNALLSLESRHE